MTQRSLAVLADNDGNRYRLTSWRPRKTKNTDPNRPAILHERSKDAGWVFLDEWNGITWGENKVHPKPDEQVLKEAINRIEVGQGRNIKEVVLDTANGWRQESPTQPDIDSSITIKTI